MQLSEEQVQALAHRICSNYTHSEDVDFRRYEFGKLTLLQFAGAIETALRAQAEARPVAWILKADLARIKEMTDVWAYWRETGHVAEDDEVALFTHPAPAAAQAGLSEEEWLALAERHAKADWNSEQPDGYLNAVKSLVRDALSRAPATPQSEQKCPADDSWNCKYCHQAQTCTLHSDTQSSKFAATVIGRHDPIGLVSRLRIHGEDRANTAFARSTMREAAGVLEDQAKATPDRRNAWPKVLGVGRNNEHSRNLILYLGAAPTDEELRAIHDALRAQSAQPAMCKSCGGNDMDMPCAYPEGGQPHCLKYAAQPAEPSQPQYKHSADGKRTTLLNAADIIREAQQPAEPSGDERAALAGAIEALECPDTRYCSNPELYEQGFLHARSAAAEMARAAQSGQRAGVAEDWVAVPRWKLERAASVLEQRDVDDRGVAVDLRAMLATAPAAQTQVEGGADAQSA